MKISTRIIIGPLAFLTTAALMICVFAVVVIFLPFILYQELSDSAAFRRRRKLWKDLKNKKKGGPHVDN